MKIPPKPEIAPSLTERPTKPNRDQGAWEVSKHFESLLVNQMIGVMRQTVARDGLVPQSQAERIFEGMLDEKYAQHIADSEQIGLAHMIYQQLVRK